MSTAADDEVSRKAPHGSPLNHPLFTIQNLLLTRELALLYGNLSFFTAVNNDIQVLLANAPPGPGGALSVPPAAPPAQVADGEPKRSGESATVH